MRSLFAWLGAVALPALVLLCAPAALAGVCDFYCPSAAIPLSVVEGHGIQHGSATINIKNAVTSSLLPDLNYIEDEDNGQDFRVDDPFFGIPTIVRRDGMLKIKTDRHRLPVVFNLYDASGSYIPFPLAIPGNKTVSWPAAALPCVVYYSISSPLSTAQVGMIVVTEPADELLGLLLGAADGVIGDLCNAAPKADLAVLDLSSGDNSGFSSIAPGSSVVWYSSFDAATTLTFSNGLLVDVPAQGQSAPVVFDTEGVYSYTASGHTGSAIVQVTGDPTATEDVSWGALKGRYGN